MRSFAAGVVIVAVLSCGWALGYAAAALAAHDTDAATEAIGKEVPWPRTIKAGDTTLTVYQPQIDAWDGAKLAARMAVQAEFGSKEQPLTHYGIVTANARTLTDKGRRVVTIDQAQVLTVDFPSVSAQQAKAWGDTIAADLTGKSRTIALDRLEAALAILQAQQPTAHDALLNDPPHILFSDVPAILVSVDGDPVYRAMDGTPFEQVINTRPLVLRDAAGAHFLRVFDGWMTASALTGAWTVVRAPSAGLTKAFKKASDAHTIDPLTGQPMSDSEAPSLETRVPAICVATSPTELIVTEGAAKLVPIAGTQLLYVENTTGSIFKDAQDNRTYVLIAGRWFRATSEKGPWEYVAANALPADFTRIPDDSSKENVKASIAGTTQAREAAIAASVPQTAAVKIVGTKMTDPRIDGEPVYKPIESTTLSYVVNTPTAIIRVSDSSFYAVQNAVWFTGKSVRGAWSVATSVPAVVYSIPVSSPLHYVTYVRIYAVRSDTVYVGYTPGYTGTIIDPVTTVVVYGTGYDYDPWVGSMWYGAPVTYGYGATVTYTPWTGWVVGFGLGWAWGAATVSTGWGWGSYPHWGPWAYSVWGAAYGWRGGAVAWGPGGWAGYSGNLYTQWGNRASVTRVSGGYNAWTGNAWAAQVGASYNSRTGIASAGQRGAAQNVYAGDYAAGARGAAVGPDGNVVVGQPLTAGNAYAGNELWGGRGAVYHRDTGEVTTFRRTTDEAGGHVGDDVYAGHDGNVYRNTGKEWEQHTAGGGWETVPGSTQRVPQLDRERDARRIGEQRSTTLRQSSAGLHRSFNRGGYRLR